ncbi:twin-arginine translocase TatA/TatE family subunit [Desulfococcaceae bacterium HSG8]|nr:twin-arginine translocase TatA/TatE family subunit [Desulfococcaceae bacterium HSG8]
MFGIGMPELILILAVALIVIGPSKLPELAKSLGRAIGEFKQATSEFKESLEIDYELKDVKKTFDDMNDDLRETIEPKDTSDKEKISDDIITSGTRVPPYEETEDKGYLDEYSQDTENDKPVSDESRTSPEEKILKKKKEKSEGTDKDDEGK